jgi:hypothetical protein
MRQVPGTDLNGLGFRLAAPGYDGEALFDPQVMDGSTAIKSLYGARKLLMLEFLIHSRYTGKDLHEQLARLGYDPETVLYGGRKQSLYPENKTVNEMEALRDFIVAESLNYGLISSETAFIAVYHKAGKRVEAMALVPNALPEGWSEDFLCEKEMSVNCCSPIMQAPPAPVRSVLPGGKQSKMSCSDIVDIDRFESMVDRKDAMLPVDDSPVIFSGKPQFTGSEAVIFDSSKNGSADVLKGATSISQMKVVFPGGMPKSESIDKGLSLLIYVGDMSTPRAVVRIADLIRQRGVRPLNILVDGAVKVVLVDPAMAWAKGMPAIKVSVKIV